MTAPTFDRELIDAARTLRYENPAGWRQFLAAHPELAAEAEKPKPSRDAKGEGNSKGLEPYSCWSDVDRGRWERNIGTWPEGSRPNDAIDYERLRDEGDERMSLVQLHAETDGGYTVGLKAISNQNQLEVCRLCGNELKLPTDPDGLVYRDVGGQPEYCSQRCRDDVRNARARAKRAEESPRRKPLRRLPDLSTITVAGIGDVGIAIEVWNRLQPRRDPEVFRPIPAPLTMTSPLPYSPAREGYRLPVQQFVANLRRRPAWSGDKWAKAIPRRERLLSADRIARRYGTGGTPKPPELTPGWDQVVSRWKYFPRSQDSGHTLISDDCNVWRISHCNAA